MGDDGATEGDHTDRDPVEFGAGTPPLEWAMAALGALLVGGMLSVLVVDGLTAPTGPPAFRTEVVATAEQARATLVLVEVTNTGGRSAEAVVVRAETDGVEVAEAQIDDVPRGATQQVGLLVDPSVRLGDLHVRVTGFRQP